MASKMVPASPHSLSYFMKKTKADGRPNAYNRAYTLWKREKQATRRGDTTTKNGESPKRTPVTANDVKATDAPKRGGSDRRNYGQAAATAGAVAAAGAGAFGLARNIRAREARMERSARQSNAQQAAKEARDKQAAKDAKAKQRAEVARAHASRSVGGALEQTNTSGKSARGPRTPVVNDAPSPQARAYGGGKFGGNSKYSARR